MTPYYKWLLADNSPLVGADKLVPGDCTLRLFACDCAARVAHLAKDERSHNAIAVARRFARGQATQEELDAARGGAWDAVWDAWEASKVTALVVALAARRSAFATGSAIALDAARDASTTARSAARSAAYDPERDAQNARLLQYINHGEAAEAMEWPQ